MKLLLSTLAVIGMTAIAPPAFAVDSSISALCRAGADDAYSRPGGFCDQVASNASLLDSKGSECHDGYEWNGYEYVCTKS